MNLRLWFLLGYIRIQLFILFWIYGSGSRSKNCTVLEKQGMHALMFAQEYLRPQTDVCCNVAGLVIASHQFHPAHARSNVCMALRTQQTRTNKPTSFPRKGGIGLQTNLHHTVFFTNINLRKITMQCSNVSMFPGWLNKINNKYSKNHCKYRYFIWQDNKILSETDFTPYTIIRLLHIEPTGCFLRNFGYHH